MFSISKKLSRARMSLLTFGVIALLASSSCQAHEPAETVASSAAPSSVDQTKADKTPKENWCLQKTEDESQNLVFIASNLGYRNFSHKVDATWLLQVNITTKQQNPKGHPTKEEALVLNDVEDQITATLRGVSQVHFIGRATIRGSRELVYYVKNAEDINGALSTLVKKPQVRQWEYRITPDAEWKHADDLIGGEPHCL